MIVELPDHLNQKAVFLFGGSMRRLRLHAQNYRGAKVLTAEDKKKFKNMQFSAKNSEDFLAEIKEIVRNINATYASPKDCEEARLLVHKAAKNKLCDALLKDVRIGLSDVELLALIFSYTMPFENALAKAREAVELYGNLVSVLVDRSSDVMENININTRQATLLALMNGSCRKMCWEFLE